MRKKRVKPLNIEEYLAQRLWQNDPYLTRPGGIKSCIQCNKSYYTSEFEDNEDTVDQKESVCNFCINTDKLAKKNKKKDIT